MPISENGIEKATDELNGRGFDITHVETREAITAYLDVVATEDAAPEPPVSAEPTQQQLDAAWARVAPLVGCDPTSAADPVPSGWRDISTAPKRDRKKRTDVLLGSFPKGAIAVGEAHRPPRDCFTTMDGTYHAPTHWQPLPAAPEPPVSDGMTQAVRDVLDERQRQIAKGWTADHDDGHANSEIINEWFGARERLWKATLKTPPDRQLLVEAAAQVIAEIERVDRIPGQSEIIAARVNGEQKS